MPWSLWTMVSACYSISGLTDVTAGLGEANHRALFFSFCKLLSLCPVTNGVSVKYSASLNNVLVCFLLILSLQQGILSHHAASHTHHWPTPFCCCSDDLIQLYNFTPSHKCWTLQIYIIWNLRYVALWGGGGGGGGEGGGEEELRYVGQEAILRMNRGL